MLQECCIGLAARTIHLFYMGALALWIGGAVGVGALGVSATFRTLSDRAVAAEVAGAMLLRLTLLKLSLIPVLAIAALLRLIVWEAERMTALIGLRYLLLFLLTQVALGGLLFLAPALRKLRGQADRPQGDATLDAEGLRKFDRLRGMSVLLALAEALIGFGVLFLD